MDRDLTATERGVLEWLLRDPSIADVETLRAQIPLAKAVDGEPALPTYLHLAVSGTRAAACEDGRLPGGAVVMSGSGEPTGGLILWVRNGYLESVEHWWVTDDMPLDFPSVESLRPFSPAEG